VEELRLELQACNIVHSGTAKSDPQHVFLRALGLLPQAAMASFADVGLGPRLRTSSDQSSSDVELQFQLRRLELEFEEKKQQREHELHEAARVR